MNLKNSKYLRHLKLLGLILMNIKLIKKEEIPYLMNIKLINKEEIPYLMNIKLIIS